MCPPIFLLETKSCLHSKPHFSPKKPMCFHHVFHSSPSKSMTFHDVFHIFLQKTMVFPALFHLFSPAPTTVGNPQRSRGALAQPWRQAAGCSGTRSQWRQPVKLPEPGAQRQRQPWRRQRGEKNMVCSLAYCHGEHVYLSYTYYRCCLCLGVRFHFRPGATQLRPGTQSPDLHVDYILKIYIYI